MSLVSLFRSVYNESRSTNTTNYGPHSSLSYPTEYKYMYKTAVRERSTEEEMEDLSSRMTDLSFGHGGRHPMPEIELHQDINVEREMTRLGAPSLMNDPVPSGGLAEPCTPYVASTEDATPTDSMASEVTPSIKEPDDLSASQRHEIV